MGYPLDWLAVRSVPTKPHLTTRSCAKSRRAVGSDCGSGSCSWRRACWRGLERDHLRAVAQPVEVVSPLPHHRAPLVEQRRAVIGRQGRRLAVPQLFFDHFGNDTEPLGDHRSSHRSVTAGSHIFVPIAHAPQGTTNCVLAHASAIGQHRRKLVAAGARQQTPALFVGGHQARVPGRIGGQDGGKSLTASYFLAQKSAAVSERALVPGRAALCARAYIGAT
jgi:hypothetical protein